jgi:hypothetical protein
MGLIDVHKYLNVKVLHSSAMVKYISYSQMTEINIVLWQMKVRHTIKCSKEHVSILCKFHFGHQEDTRSQTNSVVHLCNLGLTLHVSENAIIKFIYMYVSV